MHLLYQGVRPETQRPAAARPARARPGLTPASVASQTHLVLIPSYNAGPRLFETVAHARRMWSPVWVVVDGSTDNTTPELHRMAASDPCLRVLVLPRNRGKGAAVLHGLRAAMAQSFTHALTLDADGQHNAADIPDMMEVSTLQPEVMVLGRPIFDASAPRARVLGRQIANLLADLQTRRAGIGDSLFGMRVYPIAPLIEVFSATRWMRRFDFDPEAAIRLCWRGVRPVAFPTEVHYFRSSEGGVSHFCYVRSNLLLAFMYVRLQTALLGRLLRVEPQ